MKWEAVTSTIGQTVYALFNNGRKLATLVFHPSSSAARIEYADEKRVFLIRKEGFLKNRTVLCNEYGIRIAEAGTENNESFIQFRDDQQRIFYSLEDNREPSLTIYKDSKDHPLAICEFEESRPGRNSPLRDIGPYSLLMTFCWYLFQPAPVLEERVQFA